MQDIDGIKAGLGALMAGNGSLLLLTWEGFGPRSLIEK